ncbi:MAG: TRAP transporter substrate-binding protein [Enterocloster sp.]
MKKTKISLLVCIFSIILIIFLILRNIRRETPAVVPEYVLTYAENQASDYPTTLGAHYFAELVNTKTEGKIEILIYDNSVLGDEPSVTQQLQLGGIDFARISLSTMADIVPQLHVLQMPYIYRDSEHMWKVLDGEIGQRLLESFEDIDMVPLSWYDAGARSFYTTNKPVRTLEDLQGMKIRVPESTLLEDLISALGGVPVPMAFDKVYSALETGQIDGAENNWPSYESTKHNEVAVYYTVDEHTRIPELQLISQATWDKLPAEYQEIIAQCARESAEYERILWKRRVQSSKENVIKKGCQVIELSAEEKQKFRAAAFPVYKKYCYDYMDLVQEIRNLK